VSIKTSSKGNKMKEKIYPVKTTTSEDCPEYG
jgi:hypothetical protein